MMNVVGIVLVLFPCVVQVYSESEVGLGAAGDGLAALAQLRVFEAAAAYSVESAVLLNDVAAAVRDKELGYKIKATLHVAPLWTHHHRQYLLKFDLHSPKLHLRGKHISAEFLPHVSIWDSHSESTFYAHWNQGSIETVYLDPEEPLDILNYKKSLVSLFQFQTMDGEYNETDISGTCDIIYETISINVFRKIKRRCSSDEAGVSSARRATRYTLEAGAGAGAGAGIDTVYADEVVRVGEQGAGLGLKARSWVALRRLQAAAVPLPAASLAASLDAALAALPARLRPLPGPLALESPPPAPAPDHGTIDHTDDKSLEAAMAEDEEALAGEEAGEAGHAATAAAFLRLVPALRAASRERLARLLQRHAGHRLLPALCRALGLAAAPAAHHAAAHFLRLHAADALHPLARVYLAAVALAAAPHARVVRELLRLGEEARDPTVARAALLAAARAAHAAHAADRTLAEEVRLAVVRSLARCGDEPCRATRLHALANLAPADPDTVELLLSHAERGALAAVDALEALPPAALPARRLRRLGAVALSARAPLEVRAAALDLAVRRGAARVGSLAWLARALAGGGGGGREGELRRVLWQRLEALDAARPLAALLEGPTVGWDARAAGGTSSVVAREAWAAGGWRASLDSVQVAERGTLRRGRVRLEARGPAHGDLPAYPLMEVEVWTRGLDALAGGAAEGAEGAEVEGEAVAGGVSVGVGGAHMSPMTLFSGQAELLGHVWAGTGSAATPVARAVAPLGAGGQAWGWVPLAGGCAVGVRVQAATALALDGAAHASLWWRSAHAALALRAGAWLEARAAVRTAWGRVEARAASRVDVQLRIASDLDFYGEVALCVRVQLDPYTTQRNVTLQSEQGVAGGRRLRVQRRRGEETARAGRSLALGRPNDAVCRTLRAADADADAPAL